MPPKLLPTRNGNCQANSLSVHLTPSLFEWILIPLLLDSDRSSSFAVCLACLGSEPYRFGHGGVSVSISVEFQPRFPESSIRSHSRGWAPSPGLLAEGECGRFRGKSA